MCWSAALSERNAAHLRSTAAPDSILLHVTPIDGNLATAEDSLAWLELLARYDPVARNDAGVVLRRRAIPRDQGLLRIVRLTTTLGARIEVPAGAEPVVVKIHVEPTLFGRLLSFVLRPSDVHLEIDGPSHRFRLVPAVAASGILVSPLVTDDAGVLNLYERPSATRTHTLRVTTVASRWPAALHDRVEVELLRLKTISD